ncbi:MAG: YbaK/EbsC family protein [Alphaproteobacteria bacterium]|nr:YbaK/EbsC family protein [Alphaproteobacteria bacterium]
MNGAALLERAPVRRVREALAAAGAAGAVRVLAETARTAEDAARALGCETGAIVKSLVFRAGEEAVMALLAGDRRCDAAKLQKALGLAMPPGRADADFVQLWTGYSIGGVAPLGHLRPIPVAIDASLARFPRIFAAAGHPHCIFPTDIAELQRLTGGICADLAQG